MSFKFLKSRINERLDSVEIMLRRGVNYSFGELGTVMYICTGWKRLANRSRDTRASLTDCDIFYHEKHMGLEYRLKCFSIILNIDRLNSKASS